MEKKKVPLCILCIYPYGVGFISGGVQVCGAESEGMVKVRVRVIINFVGRRKAGLGEVLAIYEIKSE